MKTFSEKLLELRRREGLSQEQLADRLGITRQSVSKWESGAAVPELGKLIALSEYFGVSVDYLVKDWMETPEHFNEVPAAASTEKLERQVEEISRLFRAWEWNSKTKVFGIPLVSVCFCFYPHTLHSRKRARGIIAIGSIAEGVVAVGALSAGAVSLGALSVGVLSIGALAFGLAALGPVAFGLLAFGPVAIGLWYAGGLTALGGKIAVGLAAVGETAVGLDAAGRHVLLWGDGLTREEVQTFLTDCHPHLWKPLADLLSFLGASLK